MGANAYVPPDDTAVDQLDVPDQSAVVVVFQYNVAAEVVDEVARTRITATTHFSVSSKAVKPTRPTGRLPAHRLPHFEFMMNPRPLTIQTHQSLVMFESLSKLRKRKSSPSPDISLF